MPYFMAKIIVARKIYGQSTLTKLVNNNKKDS